MGWLEKYSNNIVNKCFNKKDFLEQLENFVTSIEIKSRGAVKANYIKETNCVELPTCNIYYKSIDSNLIQLERVSIDNREVERVLNICYKDGEYTIIPVMGIKAKEKNFIKIDKNVLDYIFEQLLS